MGIQINGVTDSISAVDGSLSLTGAELASVGGINVSGIVTATTFIGNLTGNVYAGIVTATSSVVVAAGSAAAPSITPTGDPNTGIFFPSADTIAFGEGGAEAARIDSSGRFGIGTTSPENRLHIAGGTGGFEVNPTSTANTNILLSYDRNASAYRNVTFTYGGNFVWIDTSTERARIDSSGRLLVGTSTARSIGGAIPQLQVEGTSNDTSSLTLIQNANSTSGAYIFLGKSRGTSNGSVITVSNGDVLGGIYFNGANGSSLGNYGAAIETYVDGTVSGGGSNDMPGRLIFSTTADGASTPTERMRINAAGNVLCNTTSAGSAGGVNGQHTFSHSTSSQWSTIVQHTTAAGNIAFGLGIKYTAATPNSTSSEFLYCEDATTLRASIRSNGGLANFSANNANLSDRNAKKDISSAAGTWDCIKEWEIVNYRYKDQPDDADLNLGVIAQQVAESCPEVITVFSEATEEQPEKLGVKEQQMYWMAIKALQEAQVRIEQLETEKTTQQTLIDNLITRVAALEAQ